MRCSLALLALAIGILSLHTAHESAIGPYGLIQALPVGYFVSLALVLCAFLLTWRGSEPRWHEFAIEIIVLLVLLQGAPELIESEPHFSTAWLIAGFTNYVARTGHVLPDLDARFSWPAFFAGVGLLQRASGLASSVDLLRWWPLAIDMLYLPPLGFIAHRILRDARQTMLVLWLFPFANWVGQDYFSPQSAAFLLYLVLIAIVIGPFGRQRSQLLPRWSNHSHPSDAVSPLGWPQVATLIGALLILDLAMATGHELTPVFAVIAVVLLSVFGRTRLRALAGTMFLITVGWICFGAFPFWSGHLSFLFGGTGNVTGNISGDLTTRLRGSVAHYLVVAVRIAQSGLVWILALGGWLVGRGSSADVRTAAILTITPFLVLPVQSYGGEAGLRIYLFSIPGALCLAALVLTRGWHVRREVVVGALTVLLVPLFLLSAWGNELSNIVRPAEVSGTRALDRIAPPGATVMSLAGNSRGFADITKYNYQVNSFNYTSDDPDKDAVKNVGAIIALLARNPRGGYVIITTSQLIYANQNFNLPLSWGPTVERLMIKSGDFRLVFINSATRIYQFHQPVHARK